MLVENQVSTNPNKLQSESGEQLSKKKYKFKQPWNKSSWI